jgi:D-glycero-alpha-D-manno-heptose-7-phosphate kinase
MILARAPIRISFGGGGTDLAAYYEPWGGFVLSAAISCYAYVVARPSADGRCLIASADYGLIEQSAPATLPPVAEPLPLPKAALTHFGAALAARGVELTLAAQVPPGTGLGSSSAMAVALVCALSAYLDQPYTPAQLAEAACAIEIERLARPIGKQDQYASAFGGLNTISFSAKGVTVEPLRLAPEVVQALQARLLLFATGTARDSAAILHQQRADTGSRSAVVQSLHRIKALAHEMRAALDTGQLDGFGQLLDRAWQEKRALSTRISNDAIDGWYAAARNAGALGGKITGAGGGGFLLLYCPPEHQPGLRAAMACCNLRELPFRFDWDGARLLEEKGHPDAQRDSALLERYGARRRAHALRDA